VTIHCSKVERGLATIVCGVDVDAADYRGETPLHFAGVYGHVDIARFLVDRGADINAADNKGWAPLHKASLLAPSFFFFLLSPSRILKSLDPWEKKYEK